MADASFLTGSSGLIANQNEGTLAVCDLDRAEMWRTVRAGVGVEALSFFRCCPLALC